MRTGWVRVMLSEDIRVILDDDKVGQGDTG